MKPFRYTLVVLAMLMPIASCGITDPTALENFDWVSVENPDEIVEGVDAVSFFGDINFVGQFQTPSLCYTITPKFSQSGSSLTLRIEANSTNATNCSQTPGGFRYQGALRRIDRGTYTLRVIHDVEGAEPIEHTVQLTL